MTPAQSSLLRFMAACDPPREGAPDELVTLRDLLTEGYVERIMYEGRRAWVLTPAGGEALWADLVAEFEAAPCAI